MNNSELLQRVDYVISRVSSIPATSATNGWANEVSYELYKGFRAAGLSLIESLYGTSHSYYSEFAASLNHTTVNNIFGGLAVLKAIRHEIEQGWLTKITTLISADIFADFMEMAEHLLEANYKDAAAVIIGSTLEEHLRQLCDAHGIDKTILKVTDIVPKKAETLNIDLKAAFVYTGIEQKQVTAWLGLRNAAAHGKYSEYTQEQVALMYSGVLDFIARIK